MYSSIEASIVSFPSVYLLPHVRGLLELQSCGRDQNHDQKGSLGLRGVAFCGTMTKQPAPTWPM